MWDSWSRVLRCHSEISYRTRGMKAAWVYGLSRLPSDERLFLAVFLEVHIGVLRVISSWVFLCFMHAESKGINRQADGETLIMGGFLFISFNIVLALIDTALPGGR